MSRRSLIMLSLFSSALSVAIGLWRWRDALPLAATSEFTIVPSAVNGLASLDSLLSAAEDRIVSNDPFRLANEPSSVRYDPAAEARQQTAGSNVVASIPVRPNLTLKAIVGGPPWQAVVDGLPGQPPGTLVRAGAKFDRLIARAVTRDSVFIQGPDTSWVLSFRNHP